MHDHGHGHAHSHDVKGSKLAWALALTLGFVIGEAIAAYFAHSVALLSDAGHNLADAAALGISWYAVWIARKPSHAQMTFGYHRTGILAALINSTLLVVIAVFILIEGIQHLIHPNLANGWLMISVAAVAVLLNFTLGSMLHAHSHHDLNMRAAYIHMVGDAISAGGVVVAGIIVAVSHSPLADPIVSLLIAALILFSSWGILTESVNVLMEGTPSHVDMQEVEKTINDVEGVLSVHDLHVWTVGPGIVAASVHVMVAEQSIRQGQQILRMVVAQLRTRHQINHSTVQVEVEGHEVDEMYCTLG
jgi:cobalt-zinc-cadmium efflux system protein